MTSSPETAKPVEPTPDLKHEGSGQPAWLIVAIREVMVKLTDKTFIIGTISTLLLVAVGIGLGWFMGSRPSNTTLVVTSAEAAEVGQAMDAAIRQRNQDSSVTLIGETDDAAAREKVATGAADAFLTRSDDQWVLIWKSEPSRDFEMVLNQTLTDITLSDLAAAAGVSPEQVNRQMTFQSQVLEGSTSDAMAGYFVGVAFAVLFMMSSMVYGMQIASSVIEEKQSRIVEILVAVIPVRQLLTGKVVGNTVIAFAQMVLLLGVALLGVNLTPVGAALPNLSSAVGWFLLFFLAGFLALACIWAAAGALGTRAEDLNHTSQPLTWLLVMAYFVGFMVSGTARVVLSFVPIISSILMPVRLVDGTADWWEPVVALVVNLVFAAAMVALGERIYRRALLQTQGRLTYRQALTLTD
ncbi:MAG: ABC transporter permease [Acidobacteriota bacterium]|nr:ABC transporter permease [Acidobacteriota bacterium]